MERRRLRRIAAGIAQVEADLGPIDIVVANAGITRDAPFHKMTPEQWHQVIDTNLTGVFNTVHPVWPGMRERKFGRVIVISSINGQKGQFAQSELCRDQGWRSGHRQISGARRRASRHHRQCRSAPATSPPTWSWPCRKSARRHHRQIPPAALGEPEEIARCVASLPRTTPALSTARPSQPTAPSSSSELIYL